MRARGSLARLQAKQRAVLDDQQVLHKAVVQLTGDTLPFIFL